MRLAFMGTPDFAVPTLAELIAQGHDIACVYSQFPRRKGRGMTLEPSPVHKFALDHKLPVRFPFSFSTNAKGFITSETGEMNQQEFAALELDAAVVVAYGLLLPQAILDAPKLGCFNLHGSLLPRWRGAAPIQRAVMAGDVETGVMVMQMEAGLDTGPVLMAERVKIGRKTSGDLATELSRLGADLMVRSLGALERGGVTPVVQSEDGVTYAKKILKDEARIDWSKSAQEIDCHIRGLSPFPGAWTEINGERVKLLYAEPADGSGKPGVTLDDALTVACGEGALRLRKVQRAGGKAMDADALLKGFAVQRGTQLA